MDYSGLIQLFFERSNSLQWYWTLYVVIIGGLLAFSSLRRHPDLITTGLITVLFSFFAYKNLGAILDVSLQRLAVLQAISQYLPGPADTEHVASLRSALEPTLVAPDLAGIRIFHIASDLLTLACLWAMELRRIRLPKNSAA